MKRLILLFMWTLPMTIGGCSQSPAKQETKNAGPKVQVGGRCGDCEAIHESPIPFGKLASTDTLPDFNDQGQRIEISGIVYQRDGKTPAKDIVIYVYHTDQGGNYTPGKNAKGWEKRHGHIRGWVRTDQNGFYRFYTLRPASYPDSRAPQHIHVTVKEPDKNEYWIDEYVFEDDPFLTKKEKDAIRGRGGNGILKLVPGNGLSKATRNIILGLNIPDYPQASLPFMGSGLAALVVRLGTI